MILTISWALLAAGSLNANDSTSVGESTRSVHVALDPPMGQYNGPYRAAGGEGLYLQTGFGLVTTENSGGPGEEIDFDEGFAVPFAFGRRFVSESNERLGFDLELEGVFTDQDTDDPDGPISALRDVTVLGLLVNGAADFSLSRSFSIYGGAGLGAAMLDVGTQSDSINDFNDEDGPFLAWQVKAGVRWWANESVSWSLGYRLLNIDDAEIDDDIGNGGLRPRDPTARPRARVAIPALASQSAGEIARVAPSFEGSHAWTRRLEQVALGNAGC